MVLVVFILFLFNLSGWFLWQGTMRRLDERLEIQLLEVGNGLRVYLERLPLDNSGAPDETWLLDASLYLEQYAEKSGMRRLFLFDSSGRVWYDSRQEVTPGQPEPLLQADREELESLWKGVGATTPFYSTGQGYTKRGYVPIQGSEEVPFLGLALEAGEVNFADLHRFRRGLGMLSLLSLIAGLTAVMILLRVVRRAQRLEDIMLRTEQALEAGRLTAALAHEIRNPLGIMSANTDVLKERVPENLQETVADIAGEVERLNGLVSRFLDLSSQKPAAWSPCSLGMLVEKVVARRRSSRKASQPIVKLQRHTEDDEISAQADRLESVFDNLLDNAEHAIAAAGKSGEGVIEVIIEAGRKTVEVSIRDNGTGFSNEALEMAQKPFYSGRPKGTGLGLAIVRRIIEDHGGELILANDPHTSGGIVRLKFKKRD